MTGTGTKADPYVVETWPEVTQAIVQNDVYIQLGHDIDCKELGAITVTTKSGYGVYDMNCAELNGMGYAIKNAYFLNCSSIFGGVRCNTIKNLKFKNIYLSNSSLFIFRSDHPMYYILPTFIDCDFSVEAVRGGVLFRSITTHLYAAVFRKCSFYMYGADERCGFMGRNNFADDRLPILLDECVVELRGIFEIILSAQLVNTYVFGEVTVSYADDPEHIHCIRVYNKGSYGYYTSEFMRSNSIIDLIVHNDTGEQLYAYIDSDTYRDDSGDYHYEIDSLFVNTEALENFAYSATGGASEFKRCTTSQIHDETYLRGQGFNAETLINDRYITKGSLTCEWYGPNSEEKAYIDTGVKNSSNVKIMSEFEFSEAKASFAIGAYDSEGYGVAHGTGNGQNIDDIESIQVNIGANSYTYGLVGTKFHCYTPGTTWWACQSEQNIIINGQNYGGIKRYGMSGEIYHITIEDDNSNLIRNYIPAYDTVGQIHGMYDTANNVFYGSATAVPFPGTEPAPFKIVDGVIIHALSSRLHRLGAFAGSGSLVRVTIPPTVKKIGRYAFRNTQLQKVKIASDCTYYDTSFPSGCVIEHY